MNLISRGRDCDVEVTLVPSINGNVMVSVSTDGVEYPAMSLNDSWIYISQLIKDAGLRVPAKWLLSLADIVIRQNIVTMHYKNVEPSGVEVQHTLPGTTDAE
jgi:hypothetical protein